MEPDEEGVGLMQQIWAQIARRKEKKWEERHKRSEKEKRKEVMSIAEWKNKQEADMEDGRSRS